MKNPRCLNKTHAHQSMKDKLEKFQRSMSKKCQDIT